MAWILNKFFNKDPIVTKARQGLTRREPEAFAHPVIVACDAHALTSAACLSLKHDFVAYLFLNSDRFLGISDYIETARDSGNPCFLCQPLGLNFITHCGNRLRTWTDEGYTCLGQRIRKAAFSDRKP